MVRTSSHARPGPRALAPGLYVVATPIGNLDDLSPRARHVLSTADRVLAEDTRVARRLLQSFGATATLDIYNDHNGAKVRPALLAALAGGAAIALTSDAGTPLISDPGYKLVDEARAAGIAVHAVPGPSAVITALSVAGLPSDRFLFGGFLPPKSAARRKVLQELGAVQATLVFYETANRLQAVLGDMAEVLGARPAAVARELTKMFEEVRRGSIRELLAHYDEAGQPKGEIVLVIGPPDAASATIDATDLDTLLRDHLARLRTRDAVDAVVAETGLPRRDVYRRALELAPGKDGRVDGAG